MMVPNDGQLMGVLQEDRRRRLTRQVETSTRFGRRRRGDRATSFAHGSER